MARLYTLDGYLTLTQTADAMREWARSECGIRRLPCYRDLVLGFCDQLGIKTKSTGRYIFVPSCIVPLLAMKAIDWHARVKMKGVSPRRRRPRAVAS